MKSVERGGGRIRAQRGGGVTSASLERGVGISAKASIEHRGAGGGRRGGSFLYSAIYSRAQTVDCAGGW